MGRTAPDDYSAQLFSFLSAEADQRPPVASDPLSETDPFAATPDLSTADSPAGPAGPTGPSTPAPAQPGGGLDLSLGIAQAKLRTPSPPAPRRTFLGG